MYFENIAAMAGKTDWGWGPESGVKNEVVKAWIEIWKVKKKEEIDGEHIDKSVGVGNQLTTKEGRLQDSKLEDLENASAIERKGIFNKEMINFVLKYC